MKKRAVTLLTLFAVSINLMACGGKDAQESSADTSTEQVIAETTEQAETELRKKCFRKANTGANLRMN